MKPNFEKDPRRQPEKTDQMNGAAFRGLAPSCRDHMVVDLTEVKTPINGTIAGQFNASWQRPWWR
jgi:hypothetical protein